jgi:acyl carrier protein
MSTSANIPELDSMALADLVRELEQRVRMVSLRIAIEGEGVAADAFENVARLSAFIDGKLH